MIEIKNLSKVFGEHTVVDDISLTIKKGTIFGFLGPNGAGKTTTIKMLVGLDKPSGGSVRIAGKDPTEYHTRESIGFMPETPSFYDHLTGYEFLAFCGDLFHEKRTTNASLSHSRTEPAGSRSGREGAPRSAECESEAFVVRAHYLDTLKRVGMLEAKDEMIKNYSKGMKQRLAFAQAIVNDPDYLFLDEPLDGLDPIGRRELKKIIKSLSKEGKTIFFNSHILFDTEELCDEIGILNRGSIIYSGPIQDFTKGRQLEEQFVTSIEKLS